MRRLDRRVTIQRKTVTQDESGQEIATWTAIAHRRPAFVAPVRGEERFAAQQVIARQQTTFTMRWSETVADVSPLDRILYPPPSDQNAQSPAVDTIYDVIEVVEVGRRDGLRIMAARRAEIAA